MHEKRAILRKSMVCVLALCFLFTVMAGTGSSGNGQGKNDFTTDKNVYSTGESVTFFMPSGYYHNPVSSSITIEDSKGNTIWHYDGPVTISAFWMDGPQWIWDQTDLEGGEVTTGPYFAQCVVVQYDGDGNRVENTYTTHFAVVPASPQGQGGFTGPVFTDGDIVPITVTNTGTEMIDHGTGFVVYDSLGNLVAIAKYRHMDFLEPGESITYDWGIGPDADGYEYSEDEGDYHGFYFIESWENEEFAVCEPTVVYVI